MGKLCIIGGYSNGTMTIKNMMIGLVSNKEHGEIYLEQVK